MVFTVRSCSLVIGSLLTVHSPHGVRRGRDNHTGTGHVFPTLAIILTAFAGKAELRRARVPTWELYGLAGACFFRSSELQWRDDAVTEFNVRSHLDVRIWRLFWFEPSIVRMSPGKSLTIDVLIRSVLQCEFRLAAL